MKSKALIIRQFAGIDRGEILEFSKFARLTEYEFKKGDHKPTSFENFISKVQQSLDSKEESVRNSAKKEMQDLFQDQGVREALVKYAQEKNPGSYIIFYEGRRDTDSERVQENKMAVQLKHIIEKIKEIPNDENFEILYIGGGHGGTNIQFSDFTNDQINSVIRALRDKEINTCAIILGSCYSASFVSKFLPILAGDGVTISDTVPCTRNHFEETLRFLQDNKSASFLEPATVNLAVTTGVIRGEILGLSYNEASADDIKNLSEKLISHPNVSSKTEQIAIDLAKDYKFVKIALDRKKETVYLTDGTAGHIQRLVQMLNQLNNDQKQSFTEIGVQVLGDRFENKSNPQTGLFINMVNIIMNNYGGPNENLTVDQFIRLLSVKSIHEILASNPQTGMPFPSAKNEAELTKDIIIKLYHKAHDINGIFVTGKTILTHNFLSATLLDEVSTGFPEGSGEEDFADNKRTITKLSGPLEPEEVNVSSDLQKINYNTQRECFNKLFNETMKTSLNDREQLKMAIEASQQPGSEQKEEKGNRNETSAPETGIGSLIRANSMITEHGKRQEVERRVLNESKEQIQNRQEVPVTQETSFRIGT